MTDAWTMQPFLPSRYGAKYALQTSQQPMPNDTAWADNLNSVVWPPGWVMENVTYDTNQTHVPWVTPEGQCWWNIIKDSNVNAWHQFTYPKGNKTVDQTPCYKFTAPPAPAPAAAPDAAPAAAPESSPMPAPSPKTSPAPESSPTVAPEPVPAPVSGAARLTGGLSLVLAAVACL